MFVGPSGCGKTTSLRMINRMIEPTGGHDPDRRRGRPDGRRAAQLRRGIGYVIQHAGLFPHRTVLDNVATVPLLNGWDKTQGPRPRGASCWSRSASTPSWAERYPAQLSGGQQQRVGVARALAADPPILLMDEPFSAVDPIVREQPAGRAAPAAAELGKTIVFVTHDIDEAIKLGDNVAVLRVGGKLAQFAAPAELLASPADDFVAGFVGRDRGYRALTFLHPDEIRLGELRTVAVGDPRPADGEWVLVVDAERRPQGWLGPVAPGAEPTQRRRRRGGAAARWVAVRAGHRVVAQRVGRRVVLPVGGRGRGRRGDGRAAGAVSADDVLRVLGDARRDGDDPAAA